MIWNPSGMTTVTGSLTRSIEDAAQEGIAGYTYTSARLRLDHEYQRNVLLRFPPACSTPITCRAAASRIIPLGAGVTWLLNRHLRLSATYDFTDQRGSNPTLQTTGSYTRSIGLLTLRVGM